MENILGALALIFFATLEGYAMTKSGIESPHFFRSQMVFTSFAILKFFLGCMGSSLFFQGLMRTFAPDRFDSTRMFVIYAIPYWRSISGCFVLGIGMYIAGTGPTMTGAQLSMGISSAPYMFAGALAGGAVFGILEKPLGLKNSPKGNVRETSLDGRFGVSYESIAIPAGVALVAAAYQLERIFPHGPDAKVFGVAALDLSSVWPGLVVGLNQIPLRLIKKTGQGGSTAIMNIISTLTGGLISPSYKMTSIASAFQFLFVYIGLGLGAQLCCQSTLGYEAPLGYNPMPSFLGAFLGLFGSRLAGGCTCGHGITGTSELSLSSMAGATSIFAGGIAAGIVHSSMQ